MATALSSSTTQMPFQMHFVGNGVESQEYILVLLHGLDSSSRTWKSTLEELSDAEIPAVAVDLRGSGQTSMGAFFSRDQVVSDLDTFLLQYYPRQKCILVGHSMGGRVAMCYAAQHTQNVAALVIEDMDIAQRRLINSPTPHMTPTQLLNFDRRADNSNDILERLMEAGYTQDMVSRWLEGGRIYLRNDGSWWSDVNPEFRYVCYREFCDNSVGVDAWTAIASKLNVPCHVLVADTEGTICKEDSIQEMLRIFDQHKKPLSVHRFSKAAHSIHNSAPTEFMGTLLNIIAPVTQEGGQPLDE
jgi:pimeloyl-ACP methyl ester carboxylesterase